jgi:hypothetical protein
VRAERGKENPLPPLASPPQNGKRCIKEGTLSQEQQAHPPTPINRPPLYHQLSTSSPRTPKNTQEEEQEKDAHDEQAAGERQGCDELKHKIFLQPNPLLCFSCSLKLSVKNIQASSSVFSYNLCCFKWILH